MVREAPGTCEVVEPDLHEPSEDAVLIRLVAARLCHSDDHLATGEPVPHRKRIQSSLYSGAAPLSDVPRALALELNKVGRLKVDELMTTRHKLDGVAQGYEETHAGRERRAVIVF